MSFFHFALFVCGFSAIYVQSEVVPYRFPVLLGRGYNLNNHKVGIDLFSVDTIKKAITTPNTYIDSCYKLIKTEKEAARLLDVKSEMSLRLKTGQLHYPGPGSYLKDIRNRDEVVELLVLHKFRTVTKKIHHSSMPIAGCNKLDESQRGTHYIRALQYGGIMVASLKIIVANSKEKHDVEAAVAASLGFEGKFGLDVKAKFMKLHERTSRYPKEYSIYATSLLDKIPRNMEDFLQVIEEFPQKARQSGEPGGIGVPISAEAYVIDGLEGCRPNPPIKWRRNIQLERDFMDVEEKFIDIVVARAALNKWSRELDLNKIKEEDIRKISQLNQQLREIDRIIRTAIANVDVTGSAAQFDKIYDMYASDGNDMNNIKYRLAFRNLKNAVQ